MTTRLPLVNVSGNLREMPSGDTVPIANGGTGATDAATARSNLGLAIGSNVQAWDGDLDAIAALGGASGLLKKTAANTWALDTGSYLTGNQTITLTGDASGSGATSISVTLATVTAAKGGTGQTGYTVGDILYASGASALSKLAGNTTAAKQFLSQTGNGSASAAPAWAALAKGDVGLGNVENTALSTWAGSANITTLGTIATGTWSGTAIAVAKGGTGATDAATARANLGALAASDLIGSVIYIAKNSAPTGFLKCNGAAVSRTTYAALFTAIGTTFGTGDGSTTFNVPDLRGEFVRGWDDSRGVDSGRAFGSAQTEMVGPHQHTQKVDTIYASGTGRSGPAGTGFQYGNIANNDGTETRPRNLALLACIRYQ